MKAVKDQTVRTAETNRSHNQYQAFLGISDAIASHRDLEDTNNLSPLNPAQFDMRPVVGFLAAFIRKKGAKKAIRVNLAPGQVADVCRRR